MRLRTSWQIVQQIHLLGASVSAGTLMASVLRNASPGNVQQRKRPHSAAFADGSQPQLPAEIPVKLRVTVGVATVVTVQVLVLPFVAPGSVPPTV